MNRAMVIGNLTRDPEMRYIPSGAAVTEFTVAVNDRSGPKETTTYIRCVAWEKLAERTADQARKGSRVFVEGKIQSEKWTDRRNIEHETMKIRVGSFELMGRAAIEAEQAALLPKEELDDLPF